MKSVLFISFFAFLTACSMTESKNHSSEDRNETNYEKFASTNLPPNLASYKAPTAGPSRGPASSVITLADPKLSKVSNKHLYVLTLLSQYQLFNGYLGNVKPTINSCSNFHSTLMEYKNLRKPLKVPVKPWQASALFSSVESRKDQVFPEYFMSLKTNANRPTVGDYFSDAGPEKRKELLNTAFNVHVEKTYMEIMDLCESGISANYYIYENFITHMKSNPGFKKTDKAFQSILKVAVFSNILLRKSIQGIKQSFQATAYKSYSPFELEVMNRFSAHWTIERWEAVKQMRSNFERSITLQASN